MKLIRFGPPGQERPGVELDGGVRLDVSSQVADFDERFFGSGDLEALRDWVTANGEAAPRVSSRRRLGPPVARPSKILCVGLNYREHAAESRQEVPKEPVLFMKATSSIGGPYDAVRLPPGSVKTDWEVELAIVIGRRASYVSRERALKHVAGYCLHNDYSEREYQLERGGQWDKGKGCDTFAPLGPWLVTPDEVPDPGGIRLWLTVNGEVKQSSSTADMIFDASHLVSYISQFMTLLPGDVISTGTPAGVALGGTPPRYLVAGDVVELGGDGLGIQRQVIQAHTRRVR